MGDRLTQLQDAVDQVLQPPLLRHPVDVNQLTLWHSSRSSSSHVCISSRDGTISRRWVQTTNAQLLYVALTICGVDPLPADEFAAGLKELSRDLIIKEQQIEVLISNLPGLDNSERDQERNIKDLEEDLKAAEAQRQDALKERDQILAELDSVIRSVRRP
ncbi:Mediator of RNA polymerase II transcription subunit 21 [Metarhizium anisopliae]